jgi:hypothetical protein
MIAKVTTPKIKPTLMWKVDMVNPSKNQKKDGRIPLGAFKVYMDLAPTSPWPPLAPPQNTHTKQQKGQSLQIAYREEQFV